LNGSAKNGVSRADRQVAAGQRIGDLELAAAYDRLGANRGVSIDRIHQVLKRRGCSSINGKSAVLRAYSLDHAKVAAIVEVNNSQFSGRV